MNASEKIKTTDNKIKQNKDQYNLDRQTANIFALPSRNFDKCEFLTSEDVLRKKDFLEEAATITRLKYSPLCSEFKKQADTEKNNIKD